MHIVEPFGYLYTARLLRARWSTRLDRVGPFSNLYDVGFSHGNHQVMAKPPASEPTIRTLRISEVVTKTGLSKSTIYDKMDTKSPRYDPTFPRQIKLGKAAVAWYESEIDAWLVSRASVDGTLDVQVDVSVAMTESPSSSELETNRDASNRGQDLLTKRVATIREFLEERAKNATLVRYSELMERTMLSKDSEDDWEILDTILSDLSRASYAENKVLLAAHVRSYVDPMGCPRDNFFQLATELGLPYDNKENFMEGQLKELFAHYSHSSFRTDKGLSWMGFREKRWARRPE